MPPYMKPWSDGGGSIRIYTLSPRVTIVTPCYSVLHGPAEDREMILRSVDEGMVKGWYIFRYGRIGSLEPGPCSCGVSLYMRGACIGIEALLMERAPEGRKEGDGTAG
jgi:hypothetical protein